MEGVLTILIDRQILYLEPQPIIFRTIGTIGNIFEQSVIHVRRINISKGFQVIKRKGRFPGRPLYLS